MITTKTTKLRDEKCRPIGQIGCGQGDARFQFIHIEGEGQVWG